MIIADLTSPFTGGANLGDRIRMMELSGDPMVFIRSTASLGNLGGLTASTRDVVWAMDAEDYNPIIFETVGSYQAASCQPCYRDRGWRTAFSWFAMRLRSRSIPRPSASMM